MKFGTYSNDQRFLGGLQNARDGPAVPDAWPVDGAWPVEVEGSTRTTGAETGGRERPRPHWRIGALVGARDPPRVDVPRAR